MLFAVALFGLYLLPTDVSFILTTCGCGSVCKLIMQGDYLRADFLRFEFDLGSCTGFVLDFFGVLDLDDLRLYLEFLD